MHPQPPPCGPPLDGILVADFSRVLAEADGHHDARRPRGSRGQGGAPRRRRDETRTWGPPFTDRGTTCAGRSTAPGVPHLGPARRSRPVPRPRGSPTAPMWIIENFLPAPWTGSACPMTLSPRIIRESSTARSPDLVPAPACRLPGYDFVVKVSAASCPSPVCRRAHQGRRRDRRRAHEGRRHRHPRRPGRARPYWSRRPHRSRSSTSASAGLVGQGQSALSTGVAPRQMGNQHPSIAPYETLTCPGGPLVVACGNDGQFARLCGVVRRLELAERPDYATNAARVTHRDALVIELEALLALSRCRHLGDSAHRSSRARRQGRHHPRRRRPGPVAGPGAHSRVAGRAQIRHPVQWTSWPTTPTTPRARRARHRPARVARRVPHPQAHGIPLSPR